MTGKVMRSVTLSLFAYVPQMLRADHARDPQDKFWIPLKVDTPAFRTSSVALSAAARRLQEGSSEAGNELPQPPRPPPGLPPHIGKTGGLIPGPPPPGGPPMFPGVPPPGGPPHAIPGQSFPGAPPPGRPPGFRSVPMTSPSPTQATGPDDVGPFETVAEETVAGDQQSIEANRARNRMRDWSTTPEPLWKKRTTTRDSKTQQWLREYMDKMGYVAPSTTTTTTMDELDEFIDVDNKEWVEAFKIQVKNAKSIYLAFGALGFDTPWENVLELENDIGKPGWFEKWNPHGPNSYKYRAFKDGFHFYDDWLPGYRLHCYEERKAMNWTEEEIERGWKHEWELTEDYWSMARQYVYENPSNIWPENFTHTSTTTPPVLVLSNITWPNEELMIKEHYNPSPPENHPFTFFRYVMRQQLDNGPGPEYIDGLQPPPINWVDPWNFKDPLAGYSDAVCIAVSRAGGPLPSTVTSMDNATANNGTFALDDMPHASSPGVSQVIERVRRTQPDAYMEGGNTTHEKDVRMQEEIQAMLKSMEEGAKEFDRKAAEGIDEEESKVKKRRYLDEDDYREFGEVPEEEKDAALAEQDREEAKKRQLEETLGIDPTILRDTIASARSQGLIPETGVVADGRPKESPKVWKSSEDQKKQDVAKSYHEAQTEANVALEGAQQLAASLLRAREKSDRFRLYREKMEEKYKVEREQAEVALNSTHMTKVQYDIKMRDLETRVLAAKKDEQDAYKEQKAAYESAERAQQYAEKMRDDVERIKANVEDDKAKYVPEKEDISTENVEMGTWEESTANFSDIGVPSKISVRLPDGFTFGQLEEMTTTTRATTSWIAPDLAQTSLKVMGFPAAGVVGFLVGSGLAFSVCHGDLIAGEDTYLKQPLLHYDMLAAPKC